MRLLPIYLLALAAVVHGQAPGAGAPPPPLTFDFNDHEGWKQIFDGRTLDGWDGNKNVWRVEDGAIVGESTIEHPTIWWVSASNTGSAYIIPKTGKLKNFELKTEMFVTEGTNSGIQFRATRLGAIPDEAYAAQLEKRVPADGPKVRPNNTAWENQGYQFDLAYNPSGNMLDCCVGPQRGPLAPRRVGASRGTAVRSGAEGEKPELLGTIGDPASVASHFKTGDWNQIEIVASGNVIIGFVNGQLVSLMLDDNQKSSKPEGEIALQLEGGGHVKVMFRNIWLKMLP